jgi:hypothetical protein
MATLVSPGVSVMVVDEAQYISATQGTLPLIVVATRSNKLDASGTAIASGTIPANAGVAYLVASQRELVETFGTPMFYEVGGSVVQGSELNEYGLLTAYQYLGVSSNAYVIRANVDLAQLESTTIEPAGPVVNGTYWHDVSSSVFGLFEYDGAKWNATTPYVLSDMPGTGNVDSLNVDGFAQPINTFGSSGEYAVVTSTEKVGYYKKISSNWVLLGDVGSPDFQFSKYAPLAASDSNPLTTGDTYVRLALQGGGLDVAVNIYNSTIGGFTSLQVVTYASDDDALVDLIDLGDVYARYHGYLAFFELRRHTGAQTTVLTSGAIPNTASITATYTIEGVTFTLSGSTLDSVVTQMQGNSTLNDANVKVEKVGVNRIRFTKTDGKELNLDFASGYAALGFDHSINSASVWEHLSYEASTTAPIGVIEEGTYWFNEDLKVEILKNEYNGSNLEWAPYAWSEDVDGLSTAELQLRSSMPVKRKDGIASLVAGDVWVKSNSNPYPEIYVWNGVELVWTKLDNADQSSTNGVIFSNYSPDAPFDADGNEVSRTIHAKAANPELLPEHILMVNMDYSTYNVKQYVNGAWEWVSGVNTDGSAHFGAAAQRAVVVEAMQAALAANDGIRAESVYFNLITAPGYPELMDEMISVNKDKKEIAFVIGDAPLTLEGTTTAIKNWADANLSGDSYSGVYYPHGLSTDLKGNDVVIPASAIALRTIAYSDNVSYPWFAPAGLTRGIVSNASQVGYVNSENEFVRVRLSEGQRDVMYTARMNPIADLPNQGLVVYGQKTLQGFSSAMDRVNVARLINYMRYNLDILSRGFLFEQNDVFTRDNIRTAVERFCATLVSQRGLYDYLVVCDDTNNTPARIDRNELWVDVAIQPVKSVEFIYIPLRIRNTGEPL